MAATIKNFIPPKFRAGFEANNAIVNAPPAGSSENSIAASIQVNLASVPPARSRAGALIKPFTPDSYPDATTGLKDDIGHFGEPHVDERDHYAYLSQLISNPAMPAGYHPGYFHILQLGVFFALEKYAGGTFSAQRMHVATPPRAPDGQAPDPNAVRFNIVETKPRSEQGQQRPGWESGKEEGRG
ncbi:hypothetical protein MD484_g4818, partial [Candolleomyces efflorescens]